MPHTLDECGQQLTWRRHLSTIIVVMTREFAEDIAPHLKTVGMVCGTGAVSLWSSRGEDIELVLGESFTQTTLKQAHRVWAEFRAELTEGREIFDEGTSFVPLRLGLELVGMLVIGGRIPQDGASRAFFDQLSGEFARIARQSPEAAEFPELLTVPLVRFEQPGGSEAVKRAELLAILKRSNWNFTLAAERLGVTRQTIYNRCRALDITRPPRDRRLGRPYAHAD